MEHLKPTKAKTASPKIIVRNPELWKPDLFQKQMEVVYSTTMFDLVSGPRLCGKSRSIGHSVMKHAWDAERGRVGIFAKSVRNAKVGTWDTIATTVMEEWLAAKLKSPFGEFGWVEEPGKKIGVKKEGDTRMNYFKVKNWYGNISEIQLHSLHNDSDIEATLLDTEFSMIVFLELQKWNSENLFNISVPQLRRAGVPSRKYRWMADTNPPESGPDHFAYKLWFVDRVADVPETITDPAEIESFKAYQRAFGLHLFEVGSNPFADPIMVQNIRNSYRDDPVGWDRFILGKWTKASSTKEYHFKTCFKRELHVLGDISDRNQANWQILAPSRECTRLLSGWDIGASCNHAFVIAEPIMLDNDKTSFTFLDECAHIGTQEPISDFIDECLEKIYAMEKLVGGKVEWEHFSDSSAWQWSSKADNSDALIVEKMSFGRVMLTSATLAKKSSGVSRRIKMFQDFLKQERILISANCVQLIEMFENIRSGKLRDDGSGEIIVRGNPHKHIFDASGYLCYMEIYSELSEGPSKPSQASRLVSVAF